MNRSFSWPTRPDSAQLVPNSQRIAPTRTESVPKVRFVQYGRHRRLTFFCCHTNIISHDICITNPSVTHKPPMGYQSKLCLIAIAIKEVLAMHNYSSQAGLMFVANPNGLLFLGFIVSRISKMTSSLSP